METTEFEIEIRPNGEVKVHVKGVHGQACLAYADLLAEIVGQEKQQAVEIQVQQHRQ